MAYSTTTLVADGSTNVFAVPFPYLNQSDVHISVNGAERLTKTWTSPSTIQIPDAAGTLAGALVLIQRKTSAATPVSTFVQGSLDPVDLNTQVLQLLYAFQETQDQAAIAAAGLNGPSMVQVKQALADATNPLTYDPSRVVLQGIPADPLNPITAAFNGQYLVAGSTLYFFIGAKLNLNAAQMGLFAAACFAYPLGG